MTRKKLVFANWKMNLNSDSASQLVKDILLTINKDVDVEIDANNNEMTIETTTEDGDAKVIVKSDIKNTDDWCMEGSNWNYEATTDQGNANAEWKVVGLINSGEYKGLCHVKYTATGPEGDAIMDYYFSEDGESGYFEMNVGDQVIKQEWSNN